MEEILQNKLTEDGIRHLKVISDSPVTEDRMMRFVPMTAREHAQIRCTPAASLNLFYGEASWPVREAVDIQPKEWTRFRRLVVWNLKGCHSIKVALYDSAKEYERLFGRRPQYAFIWKMPKQAEHAMQVGDLYLFESDWIPQHCVAVGG